MSLTYDQTIKKYENIVLDTQTMDAGVVECGHDITQLHINNLSRDDKIRLADYMIHQWGLYKALQVNGELTRELNLHD